MQISTIFSAATLLALSQATSVQLYINDSPLSALHEGAGIDYFFLGSEGGKGELYDFEDGVISKTFPATAKSSEFKQYLGVVENEGSYTGYPFLQLSVQEPTVKFTVEDGKLANNKSYQFYLAKYANDPYKYSDSSFIVGAGNPEVVSHTGVSDLEQVEIKALISEVA